MAEVKKIDFEQAQDYLFKNIYAPIFFDKLAAHGIVPQDENEANEYLVMGAKLQQANNLEKNNSANNNLFYLKKANEDLDKAMANHFGQSHNPVQNSYDSYAKRAAEYFSELPEVREAVLSYDEALLENLKEEGKQ